MTNSTTPTGKPIARPRHRRSHCNPAVRPHTKLYSSFETVFVHVLCRYQHLSGASSDL